MYRLLLKASPPIGPRFAWLLISLLVLASHCCAQAPPSTANPPATFSIEANHPQLASLVGLWRFHPGDDPHWADPAFDDSAWPLLRSDLPWNKQGYPDYFGYAWYRFNVVVTDGAHPLALFLPEIVSGYQVFANGKPVGGAGADTAQRDPIFEARETSFRLPPVSPGPQTIHIALRVWAYKPLAIWAGAGPKGEVGAVGDPAAIADLLQSSRDALVLDFEAEYSLCLLKFVVGLTILALFLYHPADREYLWFSMLLLGDALGGVVHLMMNLGPLPFPMWRQLAEILNAISLTAALIFFSIVLQLRRSLFWWIACVAEAATILTPPLIYFQWTSVGVSFAIATFCDLPAYLWIIVALAVCAYRKDASARLLLVPTGLFYGSSLVSVTSRIAWQLSGNPHTYNSNPQLFGGPFPVYLRGAIDYVFVFALLVFLVRRFSLARQEETRLSNEMEAARSIQSLLVPAAPPSTPRFAVESVYLPAHEVGGDFFQILPHPGDGSLLIVVGDVTGKGLQAGMLVALLVGAIRSTAETTTDPLAILQALNRRLLGRGDANATCLALRIDVDGNATLANAGHLPPYLNGKTMDIEGALPLGVIDAADFSSTHFQLSRNDRLIFISDGIAEATDPSGKLFGFERVNQLLRSATSATDLAAAAQAFGQEDDISVISLTHTAELAPA